MDYFQVDFYLLVDKHTEFDLMQVNFCLNQVRGILDLRKYLVKSNQIIFFGYQVKINLKIDLHFSQLAEHMFSLKMIKICAIFYETK